MLIRRALILAVLTLLPVIDGGPQSSPPALGAEERAIVAAVDARNADALALIERVVNLNSGTQNLPGVRAVGQVFRVELDALGFKTEWVDGAAWHRAGHLVATHPGTGRKFLLIGHLDTVFEPTAPFGNFSASTRRRRRAPASST